MPYQRLKGWGNIDYGQNLPVSDSGTMVAMVSPHGRQRYLDRLSILKGPDDINRPLDAVGHRNVLRGTTPFAVHRLGVTSVLPEFRDGWRLWLLRPLTAAEICCN